MLGQEGVFTPILGTTKSEQMEENLNALDVKLSEDHYKQLDVKVKEIFAFRHGFQRDWLRGAIPYIFGDTKELIDNHRGWE